jgi:hypothetical protein
MPTIGGVFYERYQEGPRQGQVDPAFIKHFAFDTSGRTWRHGTERRVISWLPVSTLAQQIVRAYLHFHPHAESDDVLDFMNLVFDDLPLTLQGSESDFSENSM